MSIRPAFVLPVFNPDDGFPCLQALGPCFTGTQHQLEIPHEVSDVRAILILE